MSRSDFMCANAAVFVKVFVFIACGSRVPVRFRNIQPPTRAVLPQNNLKSFGFGGYILAVQGSLCKDAQRQGSSGRQGSPLQQER